MLAEKASTGKIHKSKTNHVTVFRDARTQSIKPLPLERQFMYFHFPIGTHMQVTDIVVMVKYQEK